MASTYSDLKFELIGTGEQSGTWGTTTNTNIGTAIQEAITGSADVTFASGNVTLTLTNTNATQAARNLRLNCTGTTGGARNLIVPTIEKFYLVNNGCADAITVKNSTGTGIAVPAGKAMLVFNNGTNVVDAVTHMSSLTLTTALAIAQGGTGASTADSALTNLGGTTTGKAVFTAADAAAVRTAAGAGAVGGSVFTAATAAAAQQAMDTEVGVDVQAYDADLTALGGLAKTDGNIIVGNGSTWVAESGATARTSLGLGTLATLNEVDASTIQDNSVGADELDVTGDGTSGQVLSSDGDGSMTWIDAGGGGFALVKASTFEASGTWTTQANTTLVTVAVIGGGGAGGFIGQNASPANVAIGGGGGAGMALATFSIADASNTQPVVVGAGGFVNSGPGGPSNGIAGNSGGASSFGTLLTANGGAGGGGPGPGGAGGSGSFNTTTYAGYSGSGGGGANGNTTNNVVASGGANGGRGRVATTLTDVTVGIGPPGWFFGDPGSGQSSQRGNTVGVTYTAPAGQVIIYEWTDA
jgi:hypothetical protein